MKDYIQRYDSITSDDVRTYLSQFTNTSTYNNHLKALKHLARMNGSDINIKLKRTHCERLITAPNYDTVRDLLESISDTSVKTYLSLCATTGIRVERLFNLTWNDIDFNNGFVLKRIEHVRTKHYRPNPLHNDVNYLIDELPREKERVFPMESKKVRRAIQKTDVKITPTQLRDFFYNQALTCGMNAVIVE
jgi:integrase